MLFCAPAVSISLMWATLVGGACRIPGLSVCALLLVCGLASGFGLCLNPGGFSSYFPKRGALESLFCVRLNACARIQLSVVDGGGVLQGVTEGRSLCPAAISWPASLVS